MTMARRRCEAEDRFFRDGFRFRFLLRTAEVYIGIDFVLLCMHSTKLFCHALTESDTSTLFLKKN